jgi:hypothetical protein
MRSMDLPRRSLSQPADQRFQGPEYGRVDLAGPRQPEHGRDWSPADRGDHARSPEDLFDNLRLSLSNMAARYAPERCRDVGPDRDAPPGHHANPDATTCAPDAPERVTAGDRDAPRGHDMPDDEGVGRGDAGDLADPVGAGRGDDLAEREAADDAGADHGGGVWEAIRAARALSDAFPGLAAANPYEDLGIFADHGYEEPYRPWFMSGDPSTPWWAADGIG